MRKGTIPRKGAFCPLDGWHIRSRWNNPWERAFWLGLPFAVVTGLAAFFYVLHRALTIVTTRTGRDLGWEEMAMIGMPLLPISIGVSISFLMAAILVCRATVNYLKRE